MNLMVLDDGETYSALSGCKIVYVPDDFDPSAIEDLLYLIRTDDEEMKAKHLIATFN